MYVDSTCPQNDVPSRNMQDILTSGIIASAANQTGDTDSSPTHGHTFGLRELILVDIYKGTLCLVSQW